MRLSKLTNPQSYRLACETYRCYELNRTSFDRNVVEAREKYRTHSLAWQKYFLKISTNESYLFVSNEKKKKNTMRKVMIFIVVARFEYARFFFFRNLTEQSESVPGIETRRNCEGFIGTRVSL